MPDIKLTIYGLYKQREVRYYDVVDGYEINSSTELVAVDTSIDFLRTRWNMFYKGIRKENPGDNRIPPDFAPTAMEIKWQSGSPGYRDTSYCAYIKVVQQSLPEL